jgi:hypothetical protein
MFHEGKWPCRSFIRYGIKEKNPRLLLLSVDNIIEVGVWSLAQCGLLLHSQPAQWKIQPVTPLRLMRNSHEVGEAMKDMWGGWRG